VLLRLTDYRSGFFRGDLVLETIRIKAVEPTFACFRLGIHEESERRTVRTLAKRCHEQSYKPSSSFPRSQTAERGAFFTISSSNGRFPGGSSSTTFLTVGGVDRHPAEASEMDFGAAMLRFRNFLGGGTEALVSKIGLGDADAVDVTSGNPDGTREGQHRGALRSGALPA